MNVKPTMVSINAGWPVTRHDRGEAERLPSREQCSIGGAHTTGSTRGDGEQSAHHSDEDQQSGRTHQRRVDDRSQVVDQFAPPRESGEAVEGGGTDRGPARLLVERQDDR